MRRLLMSLALGLVAVIGGASSATGQTVVPIVRVAVIGETNLKTDFIEDLKTAALEAKVRLEIAPRTDEALRYTLIVAQESTIGSAAAAVIGLDRSGDVALSVVRSGRFSGRGALNACAKEVAKKLSILRD